jgi:hypothetical protein
MSSLFSHGCKCKKVYDEAPTPTSTTLWQHAGRPKTPYGTQNFNIRFCGLHSHTHKIRILTNHFSLVAPLETAIAMSLFASILEIKKPTTLKLFKNNYKDTNPKMSFYWCLIEVIYSTGDTVSHGGIFDPLVN